MFAFAKRPHVETKPRKLSVSKVAVSAHMSGKDMMMTTGNNNLRGLANLGGAR
jgi:hypothetical protein